MNEFVIATSSTCDLTRDWLEAHSVPFISYPYTVNGELMQDDCEEETRATNFKRMRAGDDFKTSMINELTYYEFFKSLLDMGKDVIFVDMSVKMSASYGHSVAAADRVKAEYPGQRFYLMDTRCISGGLGLLVMNLVALQEAGSSFDEVIAWGENNKLKIAHRFTVDDLNYLKRSGRVSNASALIGTLLSIKPVLYVPDAGSLDVVSKAHGRRAALRSIRDGVLHDLEGLDCGDRRMLILHADCLEDAQWLKAQVQEAHPDMQDISITSLGVVIGAHTGPGLLTVFYLCNQRSPK